MVSLRPYTAPIDERDFRAAAPASYVRPEGRGFWRGIGRALGVGAVAPEADAKDAAENSSGGLVWPQWLALNAAAAIVLAACAANASRLDKSWAIPGFYFAIFLFMAPIATRLVLVDVSRTERIANVMIAAFGLFILRVIRAPVFFVDHDEYLHWVGAQHIADSGRLFTPNVLFPIGPFYPGLEIVTTAVAHISGLSLFASAMVVLMFARALFVGALFLIYERISGSTRVAALACLFYMGSSTFVFFDTNFSYASLAMPLLTLALLLDLRLDDDRRWAARLPLFLLALLALAITHHMTAYALSGVLVAFFLVEALRRGGSKQDLWRYGVAAACAVAVPILWSNAMGNPGKGYLGPVFHDGLQELGQFLSHFGPGNRKLFTSDDGVVAPLYQRVLTLSSVAFICLGLAAGFFRTLSWAGLFRPDPARGRGFLSVFRWSNSRLVLLTLITIGYPISMVFRMTRAGWEIGNRIGPFAFLGVGLVLAICVTSLLQKRSKNLFRAAAIGVTTTIIVIGGVISAEGPRILVPARYQVSADSASIEPMGIEAATWTKKWLGVGNHFAADRINRLLLSGFGGQLVSTTLQHGLDAGVALAAPTFGDEEFDVIKKLDIEYLFADLRLTTGRPVVGAYFDGGEADQMLAAPPLPASTFKYDSVPGASRIFDNGYAIIYDVRGLSVSGRP